MESFAFAYELITQEYEAETVVRRQKSNISGTVDDFLIFFPVMTIDGVTFMYVCAGNPLEEQHSTVGDWKDQVASRLKKLKKLDG